MRRPVQTLPPQAQTLVGIRPASAKIQLQIRGVTVKRQRCSSGHCSVLSRVRLKALDRAQRSRFYLKLTLKFSPSYPEPFRDHAHTPYRFDIVPSIASRVWQLGECINVAVIAKAHSMTWCLHWRCWELKAPNCEIFEFQGVLLGMCVWACPTLYTPALRGQLMCKSAQATGHLA